MAHNTTDASVLNQITHLVKEEEALYANEPMSDAAIERVEQLKVELDQCWDLLRQRRALRDAGKDPDAAKTRPAKVVENYEQ